MDPRPSAYEKLALEEIHAWKHKEASLMGKLNRLRNWPADKATDVVSGLPGVEWVIDKTIGELIPRLGDLAQWSVRKEAIYARFRKAGHEVRQPQDVFGLDLEAIDRVLGRLGARYRAIAAAEGAATGVLGLPGVPADIVALVALNQRAVAEHATYYGFEIAVEDEQRFAANVLAYASLPTGSSRRKSMGELARMAKRSAEGQGRSEVEKKTFVQVVKLTARALGIRLTQRRILEFIPGVGAIIAARLNSKYTKKVCDAASFLYRERFLAQKYGPETITVENATGAQDGAPERLVGNGRNEHEPVPE